MTTRTPHWLTANTLSPRPFALEPRMLFDGAAVATTQDLAAAQEQADAQTAANAQRLAADAKLATEAAAAAAAAATATASKVDATADPFSTELTDAERAALLAQDQEHARTEIVVVDDSVPFASDLLANVPSYWRVIHLQTGQDGLSQLTQALSGLHDLDAIHLFTHGSDGQIWLGGQPVDQASLDAHSSEWAAIGAALNANGDLLVYGCDTAAGFVGQQFVDTLARITGADVAASDDATGGVVMGGNWNLEVQTGPVDTAALTSDSFSNVLDTHTLNIGQNTSRLNYQAFGYGYVGPSYNGVQESTATLLRYDPIRYTQERNVPWQKMEWVTRGGWFFSWNEPVFYGQNTNFGSGTRYGTTTFTLGYDSQYQFNAAKLQQFKLNADGGISQTDMGGWASALYRGSFNPDNPKENLVSANSIFLSGESLYRGTLQAGNYVVVVSMKNGYNVWPDNSAMFARNNNYAEQLWGNFSVTATNLNRAPVWTSISLNQTVSGAGDQRAMIPLSLSGAATISDPDGNPITFSAQQVVGGVAQALPSWLTFNANDLSFTGNAAANTGAITVRLTANDGQLSSSKDVTLTYTNDNDQPVVAQTVADQRWDGAGNFNYQIPAGTFADADPGVDSFTYTATLASGAALPSWLTLSSTGLLSGNPPANTASLDIAVIANDGSGQSNATRSVNVRLVLANNNDVPTVSNVSITLSEDSTFNFTEANFSYADGDTRSTSDSATGSGKSLQQIRIVSLPVNGTLWLDGGASGSANGTLDGGESLQVNQLLTNAQLSRLRYTPKADWAGAAGLLTAPDSFQWTASDGVNEALTPATTTLTVSLVNDNPTLSLSAGQSLSVRPNTGNTLSSVTVDAGLTLTDVDAAYSTAAAYDTIKQATVSVTDKITGAFQTGDTLAATGSGPISVSYNSSTGVLTLTGAATAAQYQTVLRTLQFSSSDTSNDNLRLLNINLRVADTGNQTVGMFDGTQSIQTNQALLPMSDDFTVSVWAQTNVIETRTILGQGSQGGNNFYIATVSGTTNLRVGDGWTATNAMPTDGGWHQYTVTRTGTTGTLYIDGIKFGTGTLTDVVNGTPLRIGMQYPRSDTTEWAGTGEPWKGGISDVRIYNRVLNNSEIAASLQRDASLTGYEASLLGWFPLTADANNHAITTSWNLARDYKPLAGGNDGTDGPWTLGVITGNGTSTFNWGSFQALTSTNISSYTYVDNAGGSDHVMLENSSNRYDNTSNGWGRFAFPTSVENTSTGWLVRAGAVNVLPGYTNPAAIQFAAPVAGIYGIDARFWDGNSTTSGSEAQYQVFKVSAAGTAVVVDPTSNVANGSYATTASSVSTLRQVVLAAGEKLVFAVHKGDGSVVAYDEVNALVDINLLATSVALGGNTYY